MSCFSSTSLKALTRRSSHALPSLQPQPLPPPKNSPHPHYHHLLHKINPHPTLHFSLPHMPTSFSSSSSNLSSSIFSPAPTSPPLMDPCRRIEELHFDVPLISTRRSSNPRKCSQHGANHPDTSRRVPFLWERAPGIPKDDHLARNNQDDLEVYTPRPPPGRWRPDPIPKLEAIDNYDDDDVYSDALEKISLSESQGIPCRLSVSTDTGPRVNRAPSFIMNRFLPAANALAASSAGSMPKRPSRRAQSSGLSASRDHLDRIRQLRHLTTAEARKIQAGYSASRGDAQLASTPSKACGIMLLFPLGMKCGLKSPIRCQTSRLDEFALRSRRAAEGGEVRLGSDDGLSSRAWKSPGWGLPFLDTSRLMRPPRGKREERDQSPRRKEKRGDHGAERGRPMPRLRTPSEPWLANALSSVNRISRDF